MYTTNVITQSEAIEDVVHMDTFPDNHSQISLSYCEANRMCNS